MCGESTETSGKQDLQRTQAMAWFSLKGKAWVAKVGWLLSSSAKSNNLAATHRSLWFGSRPRPATGLFFGRMRKRQDISVQGSGVPALLELLLSEHSDHCGIVGAEGGLGQLHPNSSVLAGCMELRAQGAIAGDSP